MERLDQNKGKSVRASSSTKKKGRSKIKKIKREEKKSAKYRASTASCQILRTCCIWKSKNFFMGVGGESPERKIHQT